MSTEIDCTEIKRTEIKRTEIKRTEINHSTLAMRAAKRMRRVKHKRKNGHVICHHLMMMLDDQPMHPDMRSAVCARDGATEIAGRIMVGHAVADRMEEVPAGVLAERQYSLGLSL